MAGMSNANENHPESIHARHPSIVVSSANSPDVDLAVQALLPLLCGPSTRDSTRDAERGGVTQ